MHHLGVIVHSQLWVKVTDSRIVGIPKAKAEAGIVKDRVHVTAPPQHGEL